MNPDSLNVSDSPAVVSEPPVIPNPLPHTGCGRSLLVAATGGHLTQLLRLSERLELLGDPLWVTFDSPQSRSLLADRDKVFVPHIAPRAFGRVVATIPHARNLMRNHNAVEVVSTGSAVALAFLPIARTLGIPCHYIESAARSRGPSMTGRLLRRTPGVEMYTQYPQWAGGAWHFAGSMFDEFRPAPRPVPDRPLSVFVMLGTLDFRFDALVDAVRRVVPAEWPITWQTGPNSYPDLPGESFGTVGAHVVEQACRDADVVIAHAGVGSALTALSAGKHAVLIDRDPTRGEHIDAHQLLIAEELQRLAIATHASPTSLSFDTLLDAAGRQVLRDGAPRRLVLQR